MNSWLQMFVTVLCTVAASSGFWAYMQKRCDKRDIKTDMLIGLGHDRIIYLGMQYIQRGWVSKDEYENLDEYLYKPYKKLGGNGSACRIMKAVNALPLKNPSYMVEGEME